MNKAQLSVLLFNLLERRALGEIEAAVRISKTPVRVLIGSRALLGPVAALGSLACAPLEALSRLAQQALLSGKWKSYKVEWNMKKKIL